MNFERGKDPYETLKIGRFSDCIFVEDILHTNHKNAKYGTFALYKTEDEKIKALKKIVNCLKFPLPAAFFGIIFKTRDGYKDIFQIGGGKIVYKKKIYKLPSLEVNI